MLSGKRRFSTYADRVLPILAGLFALCLPASAQGNFGPITVGAGLRTSFVSTQPAAGRSTQQFKLNNMRLYVNGPVTKNINFMFNTEYGGAQSPPLGGKKGTIRVLDAVAQFEFSPKFNIWAGRFLPPSDRANIYGPFFAHNFAVYQDGVQDGYPMIFQGRDNGMVYWGDFSKLKVSVGAFDGKTVNGNPQVISAARVQMDFWDKEEGYYLNGNFYGEKNILALAVAAQSQSGHTASSVDFLLDRKLRNGGVFTIEAEYTNYDRFGGYNRLYANSQGAYALMSYMFPQQIGEGKIELLGKYAVAGFTHGIHPNYKQKTTEVNVTYVIQEFNARIVSFFKNTQFTGQYSNFWQGGLGIQIQM